LLLLLLRQLSELLLLRLLRELLLLQLLRELLLLLLHPCLLGQICPWLWSRVYALRPRQS
jgi:hypothetical protein